MKYAWIKMKWECEANPSNKKQEEKIAQKCIESAQRGKKWCKGENPIERQRKEKRAALGQQ